MADLERLAIEGLKSGECSIERALLIVSNLKEEDKIKEYQQKIDLIQQDFNTWLEREWKPKSPDNIPNATEYQRNESIQIARALFKYLWETKPNRYNSNFLLTEVIDSQLADNKYQKVGNCTGLTSLYTILGLRNNLRLSILIKPDHILNGLNTGDEKIVIEHTHPEGFRNRGYYNYKEKDLSHLVASVLNSRGVAKKESESFREEISDYDKAIELDPGFASFFYNRGSAKLSLEDLKGAVSDYDKAIKLDPENGEYYYNRGNAKFKLNDLKEALYDLNEAVKLGLSDEDDVYNYGGRASIRVHLGHYKSAIKDCNKAIKLLPRLNIKNVASFYAVRGYAKARIKDFKAALEDLKKAKKLDPNDDIIQSNLKEIKEELGFPHRNNKKRIEK